MTAKIRHIDFYPDEYIAGVSGQLTPEQSGVYWMICSLIYSKSAPIDDDPKWLGNIMAGAHPRTIRKILEELESRGKIQRKDGVIWVERCANEIDKTDERIAKAHANGKLGGRPSNKNKGLTKPEGLFNEKLTTNHQPPTIVIKDTKEVSLSETRKSNHGKFRLKDDWRPNGKSDEIGFGEGYNTQEIEWASVGFKDYWIGEGKLKTKTGWDRSFYNWLRSSITRKAILEKRKSTSSDDGRRGFGEIAYDTIAEMERRGT